MTLCDALLFPQGPAADVYHACQRERHEGDDHRWSGPRTRVRGWPPAPGTEVLATLLDRFEDVAGRLDDVASLRKALAAAEREREAAIEDVDRVVDALRTIGEAPDIRAHAGAKVARLVSDLCAAGAENEALRAAARAREASDAEVQRGIDALTREGEQARAEREALAREVRIARAEREAAIERCRRAHDRSRPVGPMGPDEQACAEAIIAAGDTLSGPDSVYTIAARTIRRLMAAAPNVEAVNRGIDVLERKATEALRDLDAMRQAQERMREALEATIRERDEARAALVEATARLKVEEARANANERAAGAAAADLREAKAAARFHEARSDEMRRVRETVVRHGVEIEVDDDGCEDVAAAVGRIGAERDEARLVVRDVVGVLREFGVTVDVERGQAVHIAPAVHRLGRERNSARQEADEFRKLAHERGEAIRAVDAMGRRNAGPDAGEGVRLITAERVRQVEMWDAKHDDEHAHGEIGYAAAAYAVAPDTLMRLRLEQDGSGGTFEDAWPWNEMHDRRPEAGADIERLIRARVKAGALCAAEVDRLLRVKAREEAEKAANGDDALPF